MVTPQRGMVLALAEPEYKFGAGPLLCRVMEVIAPVLFDDVLWWHVRGECAYGTKERHGGWQSRELYVIDSVVPAYDTYLQKRLKEGDQ
jgi:hypothetical protein